MTDSSIIQDARDVLAKWRDESDSKHRAWHYADLGGPTWTIWAAGLDPEDSSVLHADSGGDARLAVGTAGNPELLDAIDAQLAYAQTVLPNPFPEIVVWSERIAAAIVAANERMSA
jgi:hypothetical protein